MTHAPLRDLHHTAVATWRNRLVGDQTEARCHWRTKTTYYQAVADLLIGNSVESLSWRTIIGAVLPKGARATYYEITGPKARHSLIGALVSSADPLALQLGFVYHRQDAVSQLVDEMKVWSYWPYRQSWLEQLRESYQLDSRDDRTGMDPRVAADSLRWMLAAWGGRNPVPAAALRCSPPVCAVEDLVMLGPDRMSPLRAHEELTRVLRTVTARL
jgi:hypothetical protein